MAAPPTLLLKVNQSAEDSWPVLLKEAVGRLRVMEVVVVAMLKMLPEVPVASDTEMTFLLASVPKSWPAVAVAMLTLPKAVTLKMEEALEEATLKGSKVVVPWILKDTAEEVALTPATVPLSSKAPVDKVEAPVQRATKPVVPVETIGVPLNKVEVEVQVGWPEALLMRKLPALPAWLKRKVEPSL